MTNKELTIFANESTSILFVTTPKTLLIMNKNPLYNK